MVAMRDMPRLPKVCPYLLTYYCLSYFYKEKNSLRDFDNARPVDSFLGVGRARLVHGFSFWRVYTMAKAQPYSCIPRLGALIVSSVYPRGGPTFQTEIYVCLDG